MLGGNVFGFTADEAASFAVLDAFVDMGGDAIDTADVYSRWVPGHEGGEFENGLGGLLVTLRPTPFTALEPAAQDRRLEAWRHSRITVLRSGYQAMVRLVKAAYYSSPEVYPAMGYPGPPTVP